MRTTFLALLLAAGAARAAPPEPSLALVGVKTGEGIAPAEGSTVEEALLAALAAGGGLRVTGRSDLDALLTHETRRQLLGCEDDASCMVSLAGALGVDYVAAADLGRLGSTGVLTLKLIRVRDATVALRARRTFRTGDELVAAVDETAAEARALFRLRSPRAPTPAARLPPAPRAPAGAPVPAGRIAAWATLGVAAALLAGAAWSGWGARSGAEALRTQPRTGGEVPALVQSINARATAANWLFVGAGAAAAAGVGLRIAF